MYDYLIYTLSLSLLIIFSTLFSYKFQKDFSNLSKPSNILICFLTLVIVFLISLFALILIDIFSISFSKLFIDPNTNVDSDSDTDDSLNTNSNKAKQINNNLAITLSVINILFYLLIPFVLFYYLEETNIISYNCAQRDEDEELMYDNCDKDEELENNNYITNNRGNINPSPSYIDTNPFNLNLLKNLFYYLIAFAGINIVYLIIFKINYLDTKNNLMRYSVVPDGLRKYSHLYSEYEILNYINFGVLIILGKFLILVNVPYGAGKITSSLIENLKGEETMKVEFHHLNTNLSKNYETIKNITSQKLMTGRPLTKKEKLILKSCKETDTILQHKQEVLDDKFSNFKMFLVYLVLPIKFISIFISISFVLLFVISKILLIYTQMKTSICGKDCGFIANTHIMALTIQTLLKMTQDYTQIIIISLIFIYLHTAVIKGMSNLGIVNIIPYMKNYSTDEIRNGKILSIIYFTIFFIIGLSLIFEIYQIIPDISLFVNTHYSCDIYNLDSANCSITNFGIFYLKFYVNFAVFKYFDIFFSVCLVCLMAGMILYYPIKSTTKDWAKQDEKLSS